jgi:hypothetical protein
LDENYNKTPYTIKTNDETTINVHNITDNIIISTDGKLYQRNKKQIISDLAEYIIKEGKIYHKIKDEKNKYIITNSNNNIYSYNNFKNINFISAIKDIDNIEYVYQINNSELLLVS